MLHLRHKSSCSWGFPASQTSKLIFFFKALMKVLCCFIQSAKFNTAVRAYAKLQDYVIMAFLNAVLSLKWLSNCREHLRQDVDSKTHCHGVIDSLLEWFWVVLFSQQVLMQTVACVSEVGGGGIWTKRVVIFKCKRVRVLNWCWYDNCESSQLMLEW